VSFHTKLRIDEYISNVNILIVSSNYYPEPLGIGLYSHDLALTLKRQGHEVWVLTTFPYYPWWKTPEDLKHFALEYAYLEGIHVYRTKLHFSKSKSTFGRILFEVKIWMGLKQVYKRFRDQNFDKVISIIPSLGAGLVARKVAALRKTPHFLVIQDISSSGVSESGMSLGSMLKYIILPIERRIIRSAVSVAVISEGMIEVIKKISGTATPIVKLPNYETGSDATISSINRRDFDLPPDKFIIIHAGSIAKKQNLELLVAAAERLRLTEVQFYLYGHGNAEDDISSAAFGLENFFIRPPVTKDKFKSLLRCADLLIINERPSQLSMALPSKLISYFSVEVAVLAVVPKNGATYNTIKGLTFWAEAGDPELISESIREILDSRIEREEYAQKARQYYENELSREIGQKRYLDWIMSPNLS